MPMQAESRKLVLCSISADFIFKKSSTGILWRWIKQRRIDCPGKCVPESIYYHRYVVINVLNLSRHFLNNVFLLIFNPDSGLYLDSNDVVAFFLLRLEIKTNRKLITGRKKETAVSHSNIIFFCSFLKVGFEW